MRMGEVEEREEVCMDGVRGRGSGDGGSCMEGAVDEAEMEGGYMGYAR